MDSTIDALMVKDVPPQCGHGGRAAPSASSGGRGAPHFEQMTLFMASVPCGMMPNAQHKARRLFAVALNAVVMVSILAHPSI